VVSGDQSYLMIQDNKIMFTAQESSHSSASDNRRGKGSLQKQFNQLVVPLSE